jgi:5-methylcytosine-specific restriction endonuclease McrA
MRHLEAPGIEARISFTTCISGARPTTRARLEAFEDAVAAASNEYEAAAKQQALHALTHLASEPTGHQDRTSLKRVYKDRMVKETSPGRHIYETIRGATNKCPLCGEGVVTTLDHHLPRSAYPLLSVVPVNLVPACRDCNIGKGETQPAHASEQTLHPYFDDFSYHPWLCARVRRPRGSEPMSMEFFVDPHPDWNDTLTNRLRTHLRVFDLDYRYRQLVATHIAATNHDLRVTPIKDVSSWLTRKAEGWAHEGNPNTMGCALYRGLAADEWYANGGWHIQEADS